jgi:hypothetical protein
VLVEESVSCEYIYTVQLAGLFHLKLGTTSAGNNICQRGLALTE